MKKSMKRKVSQPASAFLLTALLMIYAVPSTYGASNFDQKNQESSILGVSHKRTSNSSTESQRVLRDVLDDIRNCNRKTIYRFDAKTKKPNPKTLQMLRGWKFLNMRRLNPNRLIATYKVAEKYGEIDVVGLELFSSSTNTTEPFTHGAILRGDFQKVRLQLERQWGVVFVVPGGGEPGPEGPLEGEIQSYGYVKIIVNGNERFLTINHTSFAPHITRVDCGNGY